MKAIHGWRRLAIAGLLFFSPALFAQHPESRPLPKPIENPRSLEAAEAIVAELRRIVRDSPDDFDKQFAVLDDAEVMARPFRELRAEVATISAGILARKEAFESSKALIDSVRASIDEAKAQAAAGNAAAALAHYDETVETLNKDFARCCTVDRGVVMLYKELLAEADKLAEKIETPEYEAAIAERDLLTTKERALWGASEGIKFTFAGREAKIDGVDIGKKITGICSVVPPRATPWHDLVIDLEFTILSEGFEMFVRHEQGGKPYRIGFKPADGYELNKPYRMTLRIKGSTLTLKQPDQPENRDKFEATTSRTGGIAFGLTAGASVVLSLCNVKVLR